MPAPRPLTPEEMDIIARLANGARCDTMRTWENRHSDYRLSDGQVIPFETFKSLQKRGFITIKWYMVSLTEKGRYTVMEVA